MIFVPNTVCRHNAYGKGQHCAEMSCKNYVNKCDKHSLTGDPKATCNNEEAKAS